MMRVAARFARLSRVSSALRGSSASVQRSFGGSATALSNFKPNPQHTPDHTNTREHAFDFTEENYEIVDRILSKYPTNYRRSGVIPLLDLAQRQCGNFLPVAACEKVARITDCSPQEVFEVASFYTMFNRTRVGKYFIQLCGTTPCMVCGSEEIKKTIEKHLGIKEGGTTEDGMFTLREVECLGACVNAPMVQINDDFYEMLTPETTIEVLEACKAGKPLPLTKWGSRPMNGQISCEGPKGKTTLNGTPPPPGFKMREIPKNDDPAKVKEHMMY